ncbi:3,4-dihydroxy-9,10-secoandrosta-1,3,5(10)-triene-9,17-dione 4,5-dioxygenase [Sphingopyxis panaciterrae]|uniref:VOC family protein n=1 Tax=Sphingopyxis panaciterrae TaxID=363841 RepID=UPI0014233F14|nr:VOC family protein [Sphingopyxis panaciterrae]NIJ37636.1 3,4-dihydroxy-9,10-secoandrosta-1,3,5(10)-triene-9,17-dione 4,5-dioxygenase [Sphingopyxis panaciterrae]
MASLIEELAYIAIEQADIEAWSGFGTQLLGFEVERQGPALTMKMDESPPRYLVLEHRGGSSCPTLGWLTADAQTLDVIRARLGDLAISAVPLAEADLRLRQAAGGLRFVCHNGISHEIVHGRGGGTPYRPAGDVTGYVTGEGGLGHTAWLVPDIAAMDRLMLGALGMTLREEISAPNVQGHFYGCNPRHHSLAAFGDRPLHLEHIMAEMNELDDVGRAMDRCEVLGYKLLQPLGRHRTDHMVSFYVETPSGFGMEIGFDGVLCGDDWIEQREDRRRRAWGHGAALRNHQREAAAQREKAGA